MTERALVPKILCAGIAVQDIVMRVENFPGPGIKVAASEFIITGGGCAANAAVAIARLKGRVAFAGPLGSTDDAVSNRILSDLGNEGVDSPVRYASTVGRRRSRSFCSMLRVKKPLPLAAASTLAAPSPKMPQRW